MLNSQRGLQTLKSNETASMNRSNAEHLFSLSASNDFPHEASRGASTFTLNQAHSQRREGSAAEGSVDTIHLAGVHGQSAGFPLGGKEIAEVEEVPEVLHEDDEKEEDKGSPVRWADEQRRSSALAGSFDPYRNQHSVGASGSQSKVGSDFTSRNGSTVIVHRGGESICGGSSMNQPPGLFKSEIGETEHTRSASNWSPKDEPMRRGDFSAERRALMGSQHESAEGSNRSSQLFTDRALNLRQEINCLDDEILKLQNSLKNALSKRSHPE